MKNYQFNRKCTLVLADDNGNGIELSSLRIVFNVKRADIASPNIASIQVFNLKEETANQIEKEFSRVILQAGYDDNFGVIFDGNAKQIFKGRHNGLETFLDITAGDGDLAYNYAVVNTTLAKGSDQAQVVAASLSAFNQKNVQQGYIAEMPSRTLPRGKVMFGMARDFITDVARTNNSSWSIQDGKLQIVPRASYLPNEAVVLTSKTGLVGYPTQTNEGVNCVALINPKISIGGRIQLDNESVQRLRIDLSVPNSPANIPAPLTNDGVYYVYQVEYQGDTRGTDWYAKLTCLNVEATSNQINAVRIQ